jgi:hypothetical protein
LKYNKERKEVIKMKKKNILREKKYRFSMAQDIRSYRKVATEDVYRFIMKRNPNCLASIRMAKKLARNPY